MSVQYQEVSVQHPGVSSPLGAGGTLGQEQKHEEKDAEGEAEEADHQEEGEDYVQMRRVQHPGVSISASSAHPSDHSPPLRVQGSGCRVLGLGFRVRVAIASKYKRLRRKSLFSAMSRLGAK